MKPLIIAIALLVPSVASAQWLSPRVHSNPQPTYQVPYSAIRFWPRVMLRRGWVYQPQPVPQGRWEFVPTPQQKLTPQLPPHGSADDPRYQDCFRLKSDE